ncbi:unnamed protein product, partial [Meganyctiphanes norvegica]
EELECEICCYIYDDANRRPKNLPCGHTFCSKCMAKEITNGKTTCPTCRMSHNAQSVDDLVFSIVLERLIRNMPKVLKNGAKSCDSEDEDEMDEYSGGPCSKHKKSFVYFYCHTHLVHVCRECTVIDHPTNKCKIVSFKEEVEKRRENNIFQAGSAVTAIKVTQTALVDFVRESDHIISSEVLKIQKWKKEIEDATQLIAKRKSGSDNAQHEISQGNVKIKNMEAAKQNLQNAKTKKTIMRASNDIENVFTFLTKWIQDVCTEYKLTLLDENSSAPANILKDISNGKNICVETTINDTKSTAKLTSKDVKLHIHPFKSKTSQEGTHILQYEQVLSHLPRLPPTLLFLDLTHNNAYQGRVYIRLEPELHAFIKNIPDLFTSKTGNSVLGKSCRYASSFNLGIKIQQTVNEVSLRERKPVTVNSGAVLCNFNGNLIWTMFLYLECERSYDSYNAKLGHVVSGLEVAKACKAVRSSEQSNIKISDCGIVLEM